jgi:chromosome segregation protein
LEKQKQQSHQHKEQLLSELAVLNDLWHQEYTKTIAILETVNARNPALQLTVTYKSNKQAWFQYLDSMVKGTGIRKQKLQNFVERYADFGAMYQDMPAILAELAGSGAVFEDFFIKNLSDLLTWQVPNDYRIEYRGKELKHHSLGQRASALILFVLSQEDNDVFIIDQPEDDLDNQTIYEDVIKLLCQLKYKTQFIFATHNANFPVLGDAEQVVACEYTSDAVLVQAGSIDVYDIQNKIVAIMEGGKEAFHRRKEVYYIWTRQNY